jgi:membrane associated rhomboid family serine protease
MFPIRDDNPTFSTAWATFLIIGLNIAAWIMLQGLGMYPELPMSLCKYGVIPGEILGTVPPGTAVPLGNGMSCIVEGAHNWYTIFSHMFMHGGWLHIIGNMWFLYIFGDNVEDSMGSARFILFYLACGLAAVVVQMVANPASAIPMVGASGAISGVMGAYIILFPRAPVHMLVFFGFFFTRIVVPAFFMLGYWLLLQLLGGFFSLGMGSGGVAFWAHVGGFVAGMLFILPVCNSERTAACRQRRGVLDGLVRRVK